MKKFFFSIYIKLIVFVISFLFLTSTGSVFAQTLMPPTTDLPGIELDEFIVNIINWLAGLIAIVCVLIIILGVFAVIFSGGNDDGVATARKWILGAIIGLIVVLAAWAIVTVVINTLT